MKASSPCLLQSQLLCLSQREREKLEREREFVICEAQDLLAFIEKTLEHDDHLLLHLIFVPLPLSYFFIECTFFKSFMVHDLSVLERGALLITEVWYLSSSHS